MARPWLAVLALGALAPTAAAQCWSETTLLLAPDAAAGDELGWSVGLDGDTAVVGAWRDDDLGSESGSAYVFERNLGGPKAWGLARKLSASNGSAGDQFGISVAISGDTVLVGANFGDGVKVNAGTAYVFERDLGGPGNWGEAAVLAHANGVGQLSDEYGFAVAIEGDTAVVGAPEDDVLGLLHSGSAFVYGRDVGGPGAWGQVRRLLSLDLTAYDDFGHQVAISGDTILVAAPDASPGAAYVFERDQGGPDRWGQTKKLLPTPLHHLDHFAMGIALDGDTIVIGARQSSLSGFNNGVGFLFERDLGGAGAWGQRAILLPSDGGIGSLVGHSAAVDGDTAALGAPSDYPTDRGSVYVYGRDLGGAGAWGLLPELEASDGTYSDWFSQALALRGDRLLVGAPFRDGPALDAGGAYVFEATPPPVTSYCTAGASSSSCAAFVTACGTASASAPSGFEVWAGNVEGEVDGMFFFGANGRQAVTWGAGGFQCVIPPVQRVGGLEPLGFSNKCNGTFYQDLNAYWTAKPAHNPGAGAVVQLQLWYMDPLGARLSDSIEFSVAP